VTPGIDSDGDFFLTWDPSPRSDVDHYEAATIGSDGSYNVYASISGTFTQPEGTYVPPETPLQHVVAVVTTSGQRSAWSTPVSYTLRYTQVPGVPRDVTAQIVGNELVVTWVFPIRRKYVTQYRLTLLTTGYTTSTDGITYEARIPVSQLGSSPQQLEIATFNPIGQGDSAYIQVPAHP
jgi:hypothetical protein